MAISDIGTGTTVAFGTSGTSMAYRIESVNLDGISRASIQTSHMGTTSAHTFMPGDLYDPGELKLTVHYDAALGLPPITSAAETVTITMPAGGTSTHTIVGSGFLTGVAINDPLEGLITADLTVKYTGGLTVT